ncbi:lytic transglycosylase domain-containing protein [Leekyejoonella antrihumi]|nr:lytic transglycosylase domain-containing protein [Leekyejoonella antrihumi]
MAQAPPPAVVHAEHGKKSAQSATRHWKIYTVRRGDTLSALAARYGTTVTALRDRNHSSDIKAGQHIAVPASSPTRSKAPATKPVPQRHRAAKTPTRRTSGYTVRSGDTLTSIALTHHTTVGAVMKANHLSDANLVRLGQELRVPTSAKVTSTKPARSAVRHAAKPAAHHTSYTVRAGDTLSSIALAHHTSLAALLKANHLSNANLVRTGQRLQVAGRATPKKATKKAPKHLTKKERTFAGWTYPEKVVESAISTRSYLAKRPAPSRAAVKSLIVSTAHRYGIDPRLALGIAWQESGWNQRAVSVCNAIGVMQVMPGTGTWAAGLARHRLNLLDARDNVTAGVVVLRYLTTHAGNLDEAIGGYYQGLGGIQAHGMLPDTKAYVRAVHAHMARF